MWRDYKRWYSHVYLPLLEKEAKLCEEKKTVQSLMDLLKSK